MKTKFLCYSSFVFIFFVLSFQNLRSQPSCLTNHGFSSSPLLFTDHVPVRKNTRLIKTDIHVFYIGSNNRVCEYTWYGYWEGGEPIHDSSYSVHPNTQLVNNGNEIFFIEQDNKICRLFFNNGWHVEHINSAMTPVRDSSDIIYQNDTIFYVGYNPNNPRVHNKVCYISRPNSSSGFGSST